MERTPRKRRGLAWTGLGLSGIGGLTYLLQGTAVMAKFDSRGLGLALIAVGLLIGLVSTRRERTVDHRAPFSKVALATSAVVLVAYVAGTHLAFATHDVSFSNGGVDFAGTLLTPNGPGPHPAAVVMHGSGPGPRMGNFAEARSLVTNGIAVLLYDKRGSGETLGGHHRFDGYAALASDGAAAVEYLRTRADIDPERVGLWGTSEGGWTAPMAAALVGDPAFLVVVSGGPITPAEQGALSVRERMQLHGHDAADVDGAVALSRRLNDYYRNGIDRDGLNDAFVEHEGASWLDDRYGFPTTAPDIRRLTEYEHWWRRHMDTDVSSILATADYPMLFTLGANDPLIPATVVESRIEQVVADHQDVEVLVFPEATHNMMVAPDDCSLCIPDDVVGPMRPWFAPGYLDSVSEWINDRVAVE